MTVDVSIGRRVPRQWFRRRLNQVKGMISFQEHIWNMISMAMKNAKKKANKLKKNNSGRINKFVIMREDENEDLYNKIEWMHIKVQGEEKAEEEEYNEFLNLDSQLKDVLKKKEIPKDTNFSKMFNSKIVPQKKIEEAYKKGHENMQNNSVKNKLLEMGILIHSEWIKDFDTREEEYITDMG